MSTPLIIMSEYNPYTPDGYLYDPEDAICPCCGLSKQHCSHTDNLMRIWERERCCARKKFKDHDQSES